MTRAKPADNTRPRDAGGDAAPTPTEERPRKRMTVKTDVRAGDDGVVNGHRPP